MEISFDLNSKFLWMALGIIMTILEMIVVSGIGFLFAGLGAFVTVAFLEFGIIENNLVIELGVFLMSSIIWWIILWYPIKRLKGKSGHYQGLLGSVIVLSDNIYKNRSNTLVWSGVRMCANLDKNEKSSMLQKGTRAKITHIKGNVLYLIKGD